MKDIKIYGNSLALENGDLKLVSGKDRVAQQIVVGLKILKGDWFLDYRAGIDYINGLKKYETIMKAEIKKAILEVQDVQSVQNYQFKKLNDIFKVDADVMVDNQVYKISEGFKI